MNRFIRALFSNATIPPFMLFLMGIAFSTIWKTPSSQGAHAGPTGKHYGMGEMIIFAWPYFAAAVVSNQLSWRFTLPKGDFETPLFICLMNVALVAFGVYYLFLGPQL